MHDISYYRTQAERACRLAALTTDARAAANLRELASEFDAWAATLQDPSTDLPYETAIADAPSASETAPRSEKPHAPKRS